MVTTFSCVAFHNSPKIQIVTQNKYDWFCSIKETVGKDQHVIKEACIKFTHDKQVDPIRALYMSYFLTKEIIIKQDKEIKLPFANSGSNKHPIILFFTTNRSDQEKCNLKSIFVSGYGVDDVVDFWYIHSFYKNYRIQLKDSWSTPRPNVKSAFVIYSSDECESNVELKPYEVDSKELIKLHCDYLHFVYVLDRNSLNDCNKNNCLINDSELTSAITKSSTNLTFSEKIVHWTRKKIIKFTFDTLGIIYIPRGLCTPTVGESKQSVQ